MIDFVINGFPQLLRFHWQFFLAAFVLFAAPFTIATVIAVVDPVLAERLVDHDQLQGAVESYSTEYYQQVDQEYTSSRSMMTGVYIWNNIGIAFRAFSLGVLAGVGTVGILLFNGLTLGAVTGYLIHHGCSDNFFSFAISHGSFELTAIVVAGAAGLLMGWGIVHPGERTRLNSLKHHGSEAIRLAFGAGVMLAIAAGIEAWFSPLPISHVLKYVVGTMLWSVVFVWLGFAGREATVDEN